MFDRPQAITGVFDVHLLYVSEISTTAHAQDCVIKAFVRTKAGTGQRSCGFLSHNLFFCFYASSVATSQRHNIKSLSLFFIRTVTRDCIGDVIRVHIGIRFKVCSHSVSKKSSCIESW